ncbi:uncharacterized protein LOC123371173 [Mauremys mutica]|uniref:uncharacterized protein LOC123371173 n=1 Tax=Mauremys mutica TaxID=74926 RepID=UPI001D1692CB|nr:uncharacterized protein LOC123371173 [Mauremys mutica]
METIIELKKQLQSATEKLHLLEDKDWKPLPQRARDEELQRLKRPTEKSPGSQWKSFSPGKKIAVETELQGHKEKKNNRKRVSKKQESKSHVIHASEEASVPNQSYLDSIIHQIRITTEDAEHNKVDVAGLRRRFEVSMSSKESLDPGLRSGKHLASSDHTWIVQVGSKENKKRESAGENVSEKQNGASSHVVEETQTLKRGISETSRDLTPPTLNPSVEEAEDNQVDVAGLRQRFEVSMSSKESLDPGLRSGKHLASSDHTWIVQVGSKKNKKRESAGENVSEKQNGASSHVVEETQTLKRGISETSQDLTPPTLNPSVEEAEDNQVDVAGLRQRFEVSMSSKESLDPGLRSGKHLASSDHTWIVQVGSKENKKRESAGENVSEKQNGASSHVVEETQTLKRGISETSRDLTPPTLNPSVEEAEDNQVDVAGLRQRFEVSMSSKESLDPGLRSGKHLASSDQTWIVQVGSKKNKKRESAGENVSEKQNGASSHVGEETQTPKHGINRTSQDMTPPTASPTVEEAEGIQVHVVDLRQRFEGLDSESSI